MAKHGRSQESDEKPDVDHRERSILVIAAPTNTGKIRRHLEPLGVVTGQTTMVCLKTSDATDHLDYERVPAPLHRYVGIVLLFFVGLREAHRGDYDAVVSVSLFPYGLYALAIGWTFGMPTHLAILGIDADHHARAWYGPFVQAAFRRFDSVSVPGTDHRRRLVEMGVDPRRVSVLANAIDIERFRPRERSPTYDLVWVGRFSREKNPLLFVRGLARLDRRGIEFQAAMVGSGPQDEIVHEAIRRAGIGESVHTPGWVEDPLEYYEDGRVYVLTSRREGVPLTLLEAMAVGLPGIVPDVGSVTDAVTHGESGYVYDPATPESLAAAMETLLFDEQLRSELAEAAPMVRDRYSYEGAREDWRGILATLVGE